MIAFKHCARQDSRLAYKLMKSGRGKSFMAQGHKLALTTVAALSCVLAGYSSAALAQNKTPIQWVSECANVNNKNVSIAACTHQIQSKTLNNNELSLAYYNRGVAYANADEFDNAVLDLTQAIRVRPTLSAAYYVRSKVYGAQGKSALAEKDATEAKRLSAAGH